MIAFAANFADTRGGRREELVMAAQEGRPARAIASWSFEQRLEASFKRTLPKLGPEIRDQLAAMITPQSLGIIASVLVAWIVSHAFGVGEAIDIVIAGVGALAIGLAVFSALDHLYDFAVITTGQRASRTSTPLPATSHRQ